MMATATIDPRNQQFGSRISHSANPPTNDAAIRLAMVSQDITSARAISCAVPCSARIVARNGATQSR